MAVPRPVLLALLGLALCATAFLATRGAREPGTSVTAAPAPAAPAPAAPAAPAAPKHAAKAHSAASDAARAADDARGAVPAKPHEKAATKPATPAKPATLSGEAAKALVVTKALGRGDAVVFFFTRPGAADDTGTRQAVKALNGARHVTVVRAGLGDLTTYRSVLSGAGVTQLPAVVVVHAGKQARLLQGYVDGGTLRQTVADALR